MNMPQTHLEQTNNESDLSNGSKIRRISGACLIATGTLEIILAVVLISVRLEFCDVSDYVASGIWGGAFAIITGSFGLASRSKYCVVITFMVLGIITAVISGGGSISAGLQIHCALYSQEDHQYEYLRNVNTTIGQIRLHLSLYIVVCILRAFQMLMSIIGTSFTCGAICPACYPQGQQGVVQETNQTPLRTLRTPRSHPARISRQRSSDSYGQPDPPPYNDPLGGFI